MNLYVLYDLVAKKAGPIFQHDNDETAQRVVSGSKFPPMTRANDFELRRIGHIDREGRILLIGVQHIANPDGLPLGTVHPVATFPPSDVLTPEGQPQNVQQMMAALNGG